MTSRLLVSRRSRRAGSDLQGRPAAGSRAVTSILDWDSSAFAHFANDLDTDADPHTVLRRAHLLISSRVRAVYGVNDLQPVSVTVRRGSGSCSQRMAVLEAVARRIGIPTRCEGLLVDGRFWYLRFPAVIWPLVPDVVVLAWPQFLLPDGWLSIGELHGSLGDLAARGPGFTNTGGKTLFDAVARTAVDWTGCTAAASPSACDLSAQVVAHLGLFDSRDDVFTKHGQTLSAAAVKIADPILRRWSAGVPAASRPH